MTSDKLLFRRKNNVHCSTVDVDTVFTAIMKTTLTTKMNTIIVLAWTLTISCDLYMYNNSPPVCSNTVPYCALYTDDPSIAAVSFSTTVHMYTCIDVE